MPHALAHDAVEDPHSSILSRFTEPGTTALRIFSYGQPARGSGSSLAMTRTCPLPPPPRRPMARARRRRRRAGLRLRSHPGAAPGHPCPRGRRRRARSRRRPAAAARSRDRGWARCPTDCAITPPQRRAAEAGRLPAGGRRRLGAGERRPAGARPLRRAHGLQRHAPAVKPRDRLRLHGEGGHALGPAHQRLHQPATRRSTCSRSRPTTRRRSTRPWCPAADRRRDQLRPGGGRARAGGHARGAAAGPGRGTARAGRSCCRSCCEGSPYSRAVAHRHAGGAGEGRPPTICAPSTGAGTAPI